MGSLDVSTLGEAMLRLSVPPGERLVNAPAFQVHVAGSEANVAYAAARVGLASAWSSALPRTRLGERVAMTLRSAGVDLTGVVWTDTGRIGTYFVELASDPRPTSIIYDRAGSVMCGARPEWFDWDVICSARLLHISGITLGLSTDALDVSRTAIAEARRRGCRVSLDVNYRALLWSPEAAANALQDVRGAFDLVISTAEDARDLFGLSGDAADVAHRLQDVLQAPVVALTQGAEGATVASEAGIIHRPSHVIKAIDRIGAGDAFAAGFIWGWLQDESLEIGLEKGLAMAALKMTLNGDLFTLGAEDVERLLSRTGREVHR